MYKTTDGGSAWEKVKEICYVEVISIIEDRVFISYMKKGYLTPMVLRSTDSGKNWEEIQVKSSVSGSPFSIAFDHVNPDLVYLGFEYLGGKKGVTFKSTDSGKTWTELNKEFNFDSNVSKIVINPMRSSAQEMNSVYISTLDGIFKSADSGETWTKIYSNQVSDFCFTEVGDIIALQDNNVIFSKDDGENWETVFKYELTDNPDFHQLHVDEKNNKIFIAAAKGLFTVSYEK
ncbi:WD40/YVTN/BNR-like repeat-containing protein [candidate division KSB1 bacterium]